MTAPSGSLAQRILEGDAPKNLRSAAARGALPLSRPELARLFVNLLEDPDEEIRKDAAASLSSLDVQAVRSILSDHGCAPEVLAHYAQQAVRDESLAELITFHARVPDEALEQLAGHGSAQVIELVLTNQERLLVQKGLLDKLSVNPALRADQRGRILELLDRMLKMSTSATEAEDQAGASADVVDAEGGDPMDAAEAARLLDVDVGELFAASEIMGGEEFQQAEDPVMRSVYSKIITLNTAQKAVLAMKGGREERMILVRDTNKVVAVAVLKNPRLNEKDVEQIARTKAVSDEVLRIVGTNREWIRSYAVVAALVRNPKTPPGISTNFVSRLVNRDLKELARDHNVPEIIRRMGKRTYEMRTQQTRAQVGKKR